MHSALNLNKKDVTEMNKLCHVHDSHEV